LLDTSEARRIRIGELERELVAAKNASATDTVRELRRARQHLESVRNGFAGVLQKFFVPLGRDYERVAKEAEECHRRMTQLIESLDGHMAVLGFEEGIGRSKCGPDHPNPTTRISHAVTQPSTHESTPLQPRHSARNPAHQPDRAPTATTYLSPPHRITRQTTPHHQAAHAQAPTPALRQKARATAAPAESNPDPGSRQAVVFSEGVEQEVRSQLLMVAIARLLMVNAAAVTETPYQDLSTKSGILAVVTGIVRILLCDDPDERLDHHAALLTRIARRPVKRRPDRSCPRRSFKPGPRWNSTGKG
jgi:hypothetical protein